MSILCSIKPGSASKAKTPDAAALAAVLRRAQVLAYIFPSGAFLISHGHGPCKIKIPGKICRGNMSLNITVLLSLSLIQTLLSVLEFHQVNSALQAAGISAPAAMSHAYGKNTARGNQPSKSTPLWLSHRGDHFSQARGLYRRSGISPCPENVIHFIFVQLMKQAALCLISYH